MEQLWKKWRFTLKNIGIEWEVVDGRLWNWWRICQHLDECLNTKFVGNIGIHGPTTVASECWREQMGLKGGRMNEPIREFKQQAMECKQHQDMNTSSTCWTLANRNEGYQVKKDRTWKQQATVGWLLLVENHLLHLGCVSLCQEVAHQKTKNGVTHLGFLGGYIIYIPSGHLT